MAAYRSVSAQGSGWTCRVRQQVGCHVVCRVSRSGLVLAANPAVKGGGIRLQKNAARGSGKGSHNEMRRVSVERLIGEASGVKLTTMCSALPQNQLLMISDRLAPHAPRPLP